MPRESLIEAAGLVADGSSLDWGSMSVRFSTDEERALADELAAIARIADEHRHLHALLPQAAPPPADQLYQASSWSHLEILEVLGRGSYGRVYRAWDARLERQVALKLFHGHIDSEAVMREGRMLARIDHPNVVHVYGADVVDGVAGLWMECVRGKTLERLVQEQGALSAPEATLVGIDVARALAAVHGAGLLHCDVKAHNVMREPGGRLVLMDLGAGRKRAVPGEPGGGDSVTGTPRYMAPELFDRRPASPQTDVYGAGVLLFYLATGRFPVDGKSLTEIREAHQAGRRTLLRDVRADLPDGFLREVQKAIDPEPAKRHQSAGELEAALLRLLSPAEEVRPPINWRKTLVSLGAVAAFVLVALTGLWFAAPPTVTNPTTTRTIAVLPIRNLTGSPAKEYLADGLTEVLISNLARVRALRVPSLGAVASLKGSKESSAKIADDLDAELLLAGSIFEEGNRARISVNLIDPRTDAVIWSEELTPDSSMLLAAQSEIAMLVAAHLRVRLTRAEEQALAQRKTDPQAEDAYLRGLAANQAAGNLDGVNTALEHFRRATTIDSQFAAAWGELANVEIRRINLTPSLDRTEAARIPRELAQRAIQLQPTLASGYVALATVQFHFDWDFPAAERTFRNALTVSPSATPAHYDLSMLLAALGRSDEAIEVARQVQQLEPLVPAATTRLAMTYYYARQYDRAEAELRRLLDSLPDNATAHFLLGRVYSAAGRHDEAINEMRRAVTLLPRSGYLVEYARVLTAAGREAEAKPVLQDISQREAKGDGYSLDNLGYIAAAAGRRDDAFNTLNQAIDRRLVNVLWMRVDPRVDPLRADPRFDTLLSRVGLRQ